MKKKLKQFLNVLRFIFGSTQPMAGPLKVQWDVLWECNSKCLTCDRWQEVEGRSILPFERELKLLDELAELGTFSVAFSGGETFLRKDIFALIERAKTRGLTTSLNSNALLVKESLADKIVASGLDMIYFSLDGATAEINDHIRGVPGSFEKTFQAIELIQKKRKNKPKIFINCTVNNKNVAGLSKLVELCSKAKVDGVTIQPAHSCDEMEFTLPDDLKLSKKNIPIFEEQLGFAMESYRSLFPMMEEYFSYFGAFIDNPSELYRFRCVAAYTTVQIHPNGDVYSCPVAFEKMGSLSDSSFKDIWFSEKANQLREKIKKNDHPLCWFTCIGPVNILLFNIRHFKLSKLWSLHRHLIKHILYKMG